MTGSLEGFVETLRKCGSIYQPDAEAFLLREDVTRRQTIEVFDYAAGAETFTRAYGLRNALKCHMALVAAGIQPENYSIVCDLGCGPGSFGIAFAHLANNLDLKLVGVDRSQNQIGLGRNVFESSGCKGSFEFRELSLPSALDIHADINLVSYWFCENQHVLHDAALFDLMVSKELLVVDYEAVVDDIIHRLPANFVVRSRNSVETEVPAGIVDAVGQDRIRSHSVHIARVLS